MTPLEIIRTHFRTFGLVDTLRELIRTLLQFRPQRDRSFDRKYGTDTGSPDANSDHVPIRPRQLRYILRSLAIRHEEFVFVDLGSGKGRALLIASEFPFRRLIGVELDARLHASTVRNVNIFKSPKQRCSTFELHNADATTFPLPEVDSLIFLYDPFTAEILREVVKTIAASLQRSPRKILIVYVAPKQERELAKAAIFEKVKEVPSLAAGYNWVLYQSRTSR